MRCGVMGLSGWGTGAIASDDLGLEPFLFGGIDEHFDVGRRGFELELEAGDFAGEIVKGDEREDGDTEAECGSD